MGQRGGLTPVGAGPGTLVWVCCGQGPSQSAPEAPSGQRPRYGKDLCPAGAYVLGLSSAGTMEAFLPLPYPRDYPSYSSRTLACPAQNTACLSSD